LQEVEALTKMDPVQKVRVDSLIDCSAMAFSYFKESMDIKRKEALSV
jgi:hypothetical protein